MSRSWSVFNVFIEVQDAGENSTSVKGLKFIIDEERKRKLDPGRLLANSMKALKGTNENYISKNNKMKN